MATLAWKAHTVTMSIPIRAMALVLTAIAARVSATGMTAATMEMMAAEAVGTTVGAGLLANAS
jgi:hypothetical protein